MAIQVTPPPSDDSPPIDWRDPIHRTGEPGTVHDATKWTVVQPSLMPSDPLFYLCLTPERRIGWAVDVTDRDVALFLDEDVARQAAREIGALCRVKPITYPEFAAAAGEDPERGLPRRRDFLAGGTPETDPFLVRTDEPVITFTDDDIAAIGRGEGIQVGSEYGKEGIRFRQARGPRGWFGGFIGAEPQFVAQRANAIVFTDLAAAARALSHLSDVEIVRGDRGPTMRKAADGVTTPTTPAGNAMTTPTVTKIADIPAPTLAGLAATVMRQEERLREIEARIEADDTRRAEEGERA